MATIVVYGGGFQPFHVGHLSSYLQAKKAFPNAALYVAASNDTKQRPIPFKDKQFLAQQAGVKDPMVETRNPINPVEILSQYDPNKDVYIIVRSERDPMPYTKKDGSPAYYQPYVPGEPMQPFSKHGYVFVTKKHTFMVGGHEIYSGTQVRDMYTSANDKGRMELIHELYPNSKQQLTIKKMLDKYLAAGPITTGSAVSKLKQKKLAEHIKKIRPLLKEATGEQKLKLMKLMKSALNENRIMDRNALINAYYVSTKGDRHKVAEKIPYYLLDRLVGLLTKKYNITMNDIEVRPADKNQYRRTHQPELAEKKENDIGDEFTDPTAKRALDLAKQHYPGSKSKQEAFIKFVQRSLAHAEQDDRQQDQQIQRLEQELAQIKQALLNQQGVQETALQGQDDLDAKRQSLQQMELEPGHDKEAIRQRKLDLDREARAKNLQEFAVDDNSGDSEDAFFKYAKMWYNGDLQVQQQVEQILANAGWEIGELESEEGGAFIVQSGDENGDTYLGWSAEQLQGLNEFAPNGFDGFEDDNRVPMHFVVEKELYNRRSKWKKSRDADGVILFATKQQAIQAAEKFNKLDPNREFAYGGTQMVHVDDEDLDEGFDKEEFRRHMKDLEAREELRKTDPVSAKALDLRGQLPQQSKKKPEDDSMSINDPRHPGYSYTEIGHHKVDEGDVVQFPKKHRGDISDMHECPKCGGDLQGGKYMGHQVQVCMPCKQVYLPPNSGIDQQGNKIKEAIGRRGILKGLGAAMAAGAAGKASAIAGAFPTPSHQQAMYKAAADSNAAQARADAAEKAKRDAQRLKQGTADIERLNKINYHGGKVTPINATWDGDSDFMDVDGTKYAMASRMPIKGDEPGNMKLVSTKEGRQVYMWTRNSLKGVVGRYFYPAPANESDDYLDE
jgi:cytidyltransferase-like protein